MLAYLTAVPGGVPAVGCARALGWDASRVAAVLDELSDSPFIVVQPESRVLLATDEGRRALRNAQAPHCSRVER